MTKRLGSALLLWLGCSGLALAADCVCEGPVGVYRRYLTSRNSCVVQQQGGETCSPVPKGAVTEAQRALTVGQPKAIPPVPPTVPSQYRKVVNGTGNPAPRLVAEMDAGEKAAVDAAQAAAETLQEEFQTEIASNEICTQANLSAIDTYFQNMAADIQAAISPLPNGANKDAHLNTATELGTTLRKMARFLCARAKVVGP